MEKVRPSENPQEAYGPLAESVRLKQKSAVILDRSYPSKYLKHGVLERKGAEKSDKHFSWLLCLGQQFNHFISREF